MAVDVESDKIAHIKSATPSLFKRKLSEISQSSDDSLVKKHSL